MRIRIPEYAIFTSFSGSDIKATITPYRGKPLVFGELQTITYSIHRDKVPVRSLGFINPRGFAKGGRTIAGTMIFTVFDRHVIKQALESYRSDLGADVAWLKRRMVTDEMPPFDVTINFLNELGQRASMRIFGITVVDESQVMSIEDMVTETTFSYMARGIELLEPGGAVYELV